MCRRSAGLLLAIAIHAVAGLAHAAPGDLDASFGMGGRVAVPLPPSSHLADLAIQPDGKIVVAGFSASQGLVMRLLPDGTLDPGFGAAGRVVIPAALPVQIALEPDGDIVVAGLATASFLSVGVTRLLADGTMDAGFGTGGTVTTPIFVFPPGGGAVQAEVGVCGLAVAADGDIVVGVSIAVEDAAVFINAMGAVRYGPAGSVDGAFGAAPAFGISPSIPGGVGVAPAISAFNFCSAMALDGAGGILLGGQQISGASPTTLGFEPILARLMSDGRPDLGFGSGTSGLVSVPGFIGPGVNSSVREVVPDALGRLVVSGSGFDLARYDAGGIVDPTFGTGGVSDLPGQYPSADITIAAAGHILTAGRRFVGTPVPIDLRFALMRARDDGSLDPGFAGGDVASTAFAGWPLTAATALAEDTAGNVVVGGTLVATAGVGEGFALARFQGGEASTTTSTTTVTTTTGTASTTTSTTVQRVGTPLVGRTLLLKSAAPPGRQRLSVVSNDPAIGLGAGPGSADDPRIAGATLRVRSDAGTPFDATYALPAAGWSARTRRGDVVGWAYHAEAGPIRRVVLERGRRLTVVGRGAELVHTLLPSPDPVGVTFAFGTQDLCLEFGGEVRFRPARSYRARFAPAPPACL